MKISARLFAEAAAFAAVAIVIFLALHHRLGIPDADAYAYAIGADSLIDGHGYRELNGVAITHWPPGYSIILAATGHPMAAGYALNVLSLGLAVAAFYLILRRVEWSLSAAGSMALIIGVGFWRMQAGSIKPDILTYAVFGIAALCWMDPERPRWIPYALWAVLIPLKLIALAFLPAAILVDLLIKRFRLGPAILGSAIWCGTLGSVLWWNRSQAGDAIGGQHGQSSLGTLTDGMVMLLRSIPRDLLFGWYGLSKSRTGLLFFGLTMLLALACLATLRAGRLPDRRGWPPVFLLGVSVLLVSLAMGAVRQYDFSARLCGYGILLLVTAGKPAWPRSRDAVPALWMSWAALAIVTALFNGTHTNSLGDNDPRYRDMAHALVSNPAVVLRPPVASNSYHLLDLHAHVFSLPVRNVSELDPFQTMVLVDLPGYDSTATTVVPFPDTLGPQWRLTATAPGARVFSRISAFPEAQH